MSVRLADRSFQYPVGIAKNMLVEVDKFTFLADFVILEMEEDSKVSLILGRPFLYTAHVVIRVEQKQLNLGVGTERMIFNIDFAMKHSYSNDDTCFSIDIIDEILEEDFDALLDEEPSFLPVIISSQLSKEKKNKLISVLKKHKQAFAWKTTDIFGICLSFCKHKIQLLDDKKPIVQKQRRLNLNMQEVVKKDIVKLLDTNIIYPITDSPWVSPIHCVPKKGDITVFTNENDEFVPTRTIFRLARYFQIPIDPNDQEKTTFTCSFGTYAYRRMPFGLCNAPATFQRLLPYYSWGSNATDVPSSSSLVNDRLSRLFSGTVRFGNDQIAKIMGYGDYQLGNVTISRVYYVEGLGHNLFFVGQFRDSDLEVAFQKNTCFIWNLDGVDLLSGSRDTNLYTISLDDMLKTFLISTKEDLARGIPKLKFKKYHMCSACALGKSKKSSHQPKAEDNNQEKLYLLHMNLCGPMRVESINGKKYILVIVDDYSRFTWVKFLRIKDEAPKDIIKCIKNIQVHLNAIICNIRTDNGTKFVNQTL
ncbi:retrovirus-related pol polyprotein from transposon TNT 1-94 [Tanacetum coccineum]